MRAGIVDMIRPWSAPSCRTTEKLAAVRAVLPATGAGIYLNTGTAGPMPPETAPRWPSWRSASSTTGRAQPDLLPRESSSAWTRRAAAVAAVIVADLDDVALTHATTDGMNIAASVDRLAGRATAS